MDIKHEISSIMDTEESSSIKVAKLNSLFKRLMFLDADNHDIKQVVLTIEQELKQSNSKFSFDRTIDYAFRYFFNTKLHHILETPRKHYIWIFNGKYGKDYLALDNPLIASNNALFMLKNNMEQDLYYAKSSNLDNALEEKYEDEALLPVLMDKDILPSLISKHTKDNEPKALIQILGFLLRSSRFEEPSVLKVVDLLAHNIDMLYDSVSFWDKINNIYMRPKTLHMTLNEKKEKYGEFYQLILLKIAEIDEKKTVENILEIAKQDYIRAGFFAFCFLRNRNIEYETNTIEEIQYFQFKE